MIINEVNLDESSLSNFTSVNKINLFIVEELGQKVLRFIKDGCKITVGVGLIADQPWATIYSIKKIGAPCWHGPARQLLSALKLYFKKNGFDFGAVPGIGAAENLFKQLKIKEYQ
jgi:hypothetical protein